MPEVGEKWNEKEFKAKALASYRNNMYTFAEITIMKVFRMGWIQVNHQNE